MALSAGNMDLVTLLIEKGADIYSPSKDVRDYHTLTVISPVLLICISVASIMHILFHCFARQGDTPLIMATKKGMTDAVKLLLDRGADISSKNQVIIL